VRSTAEQHDPDWSRYPETILHFASQPRLSIDLRLAVTQADIAALAALGLESPFAVMTAFDPRGKNLGREENERRAGQLDTRLAGLGRAFLRVDACSPDGVHCERSVAVKMPSEEAAALAAEFGQVAIFWFDGTRFWIVGALIETDPIMLPRRS
jgi:hypothetical protein